MPDQVTVAQFIQWLQDTQDPAAIIKIVRHRGPQGYDTGHATEEFFSAEPGQETFSSTDFRGVKSVGPDHPCFEKTVLVLGICDE